MSYNTLTKLIGLSAIGIAGYDILSTTGTQASRFSRLKQTKRLEDIYLKTNYTGTESEVASKLQNWARSWHASDNWVFGLFDSAVAYTKSFFGNLAENFSTLGLGSLALMTGNKVVAPAGKSLNTIQKLYNKVNFINMPLVNKLAAGLLAIKGTTFVLHNLFGIGGAKQTDDNVF